MWFVCTQAMAKLLRARPMLLPFLPAPCSPAVAQLKLLAGEKLSWGQAAGTCFCTAADFPSTLPLPLGCSMNATESYPALAHFPTSWKLHSCCSQGIGGREKQQQRGHISQVPSSKIGAGRGKVFWFHRPDPACWLYVADP